MENQETKLTEQKTQEIMDMITRPLTAEEEETLDKQRKKDFEEMHKQFLDQHDWLEKPSVQTRSAAAWTRDNIVLDSWNQYINCEARMAEFFGETPEGKGFRWINDQRRCDIALGFAHYFLASIQTQVEWIDKELEK